jgi:hypothetical protein
MIHRNAGKSPSRRLQALPAGSRSDLSGYPAGGPSPCAEKATGLEASLRYWKQQLAGPLPMLDLPSGQLHPAARSAHCVRQVLAIPASLADALGQVSEQEGVPLSVTLLAAFQVLLRRYTGYSDNPRNEQF